MHSPTAVHKLLLLCAQIHCAISMSWTHTAVSLYCEFPQGMLCYSIYSFGSLLQTRFEICDPCGFSTISLTKYLKLLLKKNVYHTTQKSNVFTSRLSLKSDFIKLFAPKIQRTVQVFLVHYLKLVT